MFHIYDGRQKFYQWDTDRKLIVNDKTITQVHFANCLCTDARKCETYTEDGLLLVDVPNELLTEYLDINVYAYDSGATKHSATFEVERRTKPTDYVYTPEEVKTWEELSERVAGVEDATISLESDINECRESIVGKKTPSGGEIFSDYANNSVNAIYATAFGSENSVGKGAYNAFIAGSGNKVNYVNSFVIGRKLISGKGNQAVFGQYNHADSSAVFVIGGGGREEDRKNAFVVYPNGNTTTYGNTTTNGVTYLKIGAQSDNTITIKKGGLEVQGGGIRVFSGNTILRNLSFESVSPSSMATTVIKNPLTTGTNGKWVGQIGVEDNDGNPKLIFG